MATMSTGPVYALNLFDVVDREEYLAYARRSVTEVGRHGGKVVALGKFRETETGDIQPRTVLIVVEWQSAEAFRSYCDDPDLADLHPHRVRGAANYVWHLFDKLEDLRPILKDVPSGAGDDTAGDNPAGDDPAADDPVRPQGSPAVGSRRHR